MDIFQKYRASFLFQETIDSISELSERSRKYIETVYDETCESAAEFSQFVRISYPFLSGQEIPTKTEQIISYPLFRMEKDMASILLMLLRFKIMDFVCPPAVLILDKGGCFRKEVNNFILQLPGELYMVSDDIISGNEDFKKLESTFDAEIFSRHSSAQASQELENIFGSHPVRHVTYSIQRDRHWRANTPWDLLLGNDKTETVSTLQPVYEPNFRKELIESLPPGTVVIKFRGQHRMTTID